MASATSRLRRGRLGARTRRGLARHRAQDALGCAQSAAEDHTGLAPKNERKSWIEVSVLGGWLLAYEGKRAVYATLISPGRGGIPQEGKDTLAIAATPTGTFPISGKLATVTMQAPGEYVHSDVPWTQNCQKPYAIHTAYWHNNWGNPAKRWLHQRVAHRWQMVVRFQRAAAARRGWHAQRWRPELGAPTLLVMNEHEPARLRRAVQARPCASSADHVSAADQIR